MADVNAYCIKCRDKKTMTEPASITLKNGRPAVQGVCPACGGKLFRMGAMPTA